MSLEKSAIVFILIAFAVAVIGFWVTFYCFDCTDYTNDFKNPAAELVQKLHTLKSVGNGSFDAITFQVLNEEHFIIDIDNNFTYINYKNGPNFTATLPVKITKFKYNDTIYKTGSVEFTKGTYNIRLYYGSLEDADLKSWTMTFE